LGQPGIKQLTLLTKTYHHTPGYVV